MRLIQFVLLAAICLAASANREIHPGANPAILNFKLGSPSILLDLLVDKSDFGDSKFLVVIIETLTPGVDVHIKDATSISVSLIECTGSSTNVCLITSETIRAFSQQSGTFSLSASCASDCLFSVKSAYENRSNLGMSKRFVLKSFNSSALSFTKYIYDYVLLISLLDGLFILRFWENPCEKWDWRHEVLSWHNTWCNSIFRRDLLARNWAPESCRS